MRDYELLRRIILGSDVTAGKPVIKGTGVTVDHILGLLAHETSEQQIYKQEGISTKIFRRAYCLRLNR